MAGPNHGSELADYLHKHYPHDSAKGRLLSFLVWIVAALMSLLETGYRGPKLPVDIHASHHSLTTEGVALFNQRYPQGLPETWGGHGPEEVNGVRYYSWSGTLQPGKTDSGRNLFDGTNRSCRLFAKTFVNEVGHCDGMVGRYSSHLGTVIGDNYPLDHFDIVNQSLGLVGKGAEPIRLFVEHAARLKAAGVSDRPRHRSSRAGSLPRERSHLWAASLPAKASVQATRTLRPITVVQRPESTTPPNVNTPPTR